MFRARLLLVLSFPLTVFAAENIWLEGEAPKSSDFVKHGWYDDVAKEGMSGKQWLSHYDANKPGTATYELASKEGGEFTFWLRCNHFACETDYQLNGGAWTPIDFSEKNIRDSLMISKNPDHRFLGWCKVGKMTLNKGANTIAFKIHSKLSNQGGIDCMVFSNTGFIPSGATKPGAEDAGAETVDPNAIWVEGENPDSTDFKKNGWYDGVQKEGFSGKEWLSHYDNATPGIAKYSFEAKKDADYVFWLRCNYFACEMDYQLDATDAWKPIDLGEKNLRDTMMVSKTPDHRFIGWVKVGNVHLTQGKHAVNFKIHSKLANHGGIDCFTFADPAFVPSGAMKPTIAGEAKGDTWFRVIADIDAFSDKSIIDVSSLIPKPAGQFGFLKRDGKDLKFEKGAAPVKFWGVCASVDDKNSPEDMALRARYFAKHGINMIRQHPVFGFVGPLQKNGEFNPKYIDTFDRWFAELKKQGIYMTWSVFYPMMISKDDGYPPELLAELQKQGDLYSTSGLVNFSRPMQDLEIKYVKALLNHVNPYTKLAYKDDPELAVLEVHNEDCIFFHNPMTGLAGGKAWPKHAAMLRQMFCEWAKKKYSTDEALQKAWGTNESFANKEFHLYGTWQMTAARPQVESKQRLGDFIHFLTDTQRDYYVRRMKELREECGFKAVTVTTAWYTEAIASPANLYCDAAGDMIDRHNYFGAGEGANMIRTGKVNNETHMGTPGGGILSSGFFQVEDQPFAMTEWTSMPPNQWKAEMAPLFAFYGMGLQGWDSSYHFAANGPRIGDGWPGLSWYCTDTPHYIGQFPALAFAIYKNHIKEAPIAAGRRLKVDDLFTGEDALKTTNSASGGQGADFKVATGLETPNEVLAIGRVTVSYDGKEPEKSDWTKYWDKDKKIVRSMTGEFAWDYGKRVVTVQAPKTHAVIGFAGGGEYDLPGLKVAIKTKFCSLIFTALDDQPLEQSKHILITALAQDKQSNTQYNADGTQLIALGGPPLLLEPVEAAITLKGAAPAEVNVVDIYGVPTAKKVKLNGNAFNIDGTYKTYYYEVKR